MSFAFVALRKIPTRTAEDVGHGGHKSLSYCGMSVFRETTGNEYSIHYLLCRKQLGTGISYAYLKIDRDQKLAMYRKSQSRLV
jgi:hypothetical protein